MSPLRGWLWDIDRWQCGLCGHHHELPIGSPPDVCKGCGQGGYETMGKPKNCKMWQPEMRRRWMA